MKARIPKKDCEENLVKIANFLREGNKAEEYRRKKRDMEPSGERDYFWADFKVKFPLVYRYLELDKLADKDCNNALARQLDFGCLGDIENNLRFDYKNDYSEDIGIMYYAEVWHFADWSLLGKFLETEFKATHFRWLSDESIEPFDLLDK
jgi:hypothetical protein